MHTDLAPIGARGCALERGLLDLAKDNGRGPEIEEQFRVAPDGTLAEYHSKGTTTFGYVIDEHFNRKGDKAEWRSTSEKGSRTVRGPAQ